MATDVKRSERAPDALPSTKPPLSTPAKVAIVFLVAAVAATLFGGLLMHGLFSPHSPFSTLASYSKEFAAGFVILLGLSSTAALSYYIHRAKTISAPHLHSEPTPTDKSDSEALKAVDARLQGRIPSTPADDKSEIENLRSQHQRDQDEITRLRDISNVHDRNLKTAEAANDRLLNQNLDLRKQLAALKPEDQNPQSSVHRIIPGGGTGAAPNPSSASSNVILDGRDDD